MTAPSTELAQFLRETGMMGDAEEGIWTPLTGGVSSDIWHVSTSSGEVCVKRALPQLKVAAEWKVSTERNNFEWAYLQTAESIAPGHVPQPLAHDPLHGFIAMAWLPPETHRLWKSELLSGQIDSTVSAAVGDLIGRIHQATARNGDIADTFDTDENFEAIRLHPYLRATGDKHPTLKGRLEDIADMVAGHHLALVHGDVSPKNILLGPAGPVLLDAECAWYGDPAFDVAFCLNHLVIKSRIVAGCGEQLIRAAQDMFAAYIPYVQWEARPFFEQRVAVLLPALALARVDGKSPLEYLGPEEAASLRAVAIGTIESGPTKIQDSVQQLAD